MSTEEKKSPSVLIEIPGLLVKAFGVEDCRLLTEIIANDASFWTKLYQNRHLVWTPAGEMVNHAARHSRMDVWKNYLEKLPKSADAWATMYLDALREGGEYREAENNLTDWLRAKYPGTSMAYEGKTYRRCELYSEKPLIAAPDQSPA